MIYSEKNPSNVMIEANMTSKKNSLCSELMLLANTDAYHVEVFFSEGQSKMNFTLEGENAQYNMKHLGFETYMFCESYMDELMSVLQTVKAFVGALGRHGAISLF